MQDPKACSIVLRGASKDVLNEVERNLHDAMGVARNVCIGAHQSCFPAIAHGVRCGGAQPARRHGRGPQRVHRWVVRRL